MQIKQRIIGIDPGKNGGIAILDDGTLTELIPMPATIIDILITITEYASEPTDNVARCCIYIEKVSARPGNGAASMFLFGQEFGWLQMAAAAAGCETHEVTPAKWQRAIGVAKREKNESHSHYKNRLKQMAQQLFPQKRFTLATCDAALIAYYAFLRQK